MTVSKAREDVDGWVRLEQGRKERLAQVGEPQ